MAALAAKLARSACTFLAVLAAVAAGAVLLIAVLMPFVFPLSLVGVALVARRLSRRVASRRFAGHLPPVNEMAAAARADAGLAA